MGKTGEDSSAATTAAAAEQSRNLGTVIGQLEPEHPTWAEPVRSPTYPNRQYTVSSLQLVFLTCLVRTIRFVEDRTMCVYPFLSVQRTYMCEHLYDG